MAKVDGEVVPFRFFKAREQRAMEVGDTKGCRTIPDREHSMTHMYIWVPELHLRAHSH